MELRRHREFHIRSCLGRGGFGEVYRATMISASGLRSEVAVKVLRLDVGPDSQAVQRLRDEGKLLAALNHPAILTVFDLAVLDNRVALVTEYVEGEDLLQCIDDKHAPIAIRPVVEAIGQVAEALDVAFNTPRPDGGPLELVHRDIKPSNIRLSRHGQVKLLDFGIAHSQDGSREAKTNTNVAVGSLAYMAPERFAREPVTAASDIYALGCTMYEALADEDGLFIGAVPVEMYQRAANAKIHDSYVDAHFTDHLKPEVSLALRSLCRDMLQHEPTARPSASEVARRCDAIADDLDGPSLRRWCRARRWAPPTGFQGAFDGQVITEETLPSGVITKLTPSGAVPRPPPLPSSSETYHFDTPQDEPTAETFAMEIDTLQTMDYPAAASSTPARAKPIYLALAALGLFTLVALPLGFVWFNQGAPRAPADAPPGQSFTSSGAAAPSPTPTPVAPAPPATPATRDNPAPSATPPPPTSPANTQRGDPPHTPSSPPRSKAVPPANNPEPIEVVEVTPTAPPKLVTGAVSVRGAGVAVQLRQGATVVPLGDAIPVGRYTIWADFGTGQFIRQEGSVQVVEAAHVTVSCNKLRFTCEVAR